MNKKLKLSNEGFLLIEAMVALSLLAVCLFFYQAQQVQLVKASTQQYQELEMVRLLSEEVREQRIQKGELSKNIIEKNNYRLLFQQKPHVEVKIANEAIEVVIKREN